VTLLAQKSGDAVALLKYLPAKLRIMNALVSYVRYVGKMVWPSRLSVFYPHPLNALSLWEALGAALILSCLTALAIRYAKRGGYLTTGWLWFLGTLVPVIGLVQVGDQAIADRYTYVPLIGLFIVIAWGIPDLMEGWRHRNKALAVSAGCVLSACAILTWMQLRTWQNTATLFEHAKQVTVGNYIAHRGLAQLYEKQGRFEEALQEYQALIRINPEDRKAHNNLGLIFGRLGRFEEGARELNTAYAIQHFEQGVSFLAHDSFEDAKREFRLALELRPDYAEARYRRGIAYERQGRPEDAMPQYQGTIFLQPDHVEAHNRLGVLYFRNRQIDEAAQEFQAALRINPDFQEARRNLESALALKTR
jgi:Tfp pilus assembly protein PilF